MNEEGSVRELRRSSMKARKESTGSDAIAQDRIDQEKLQQAALYKIQQQKKLHPFDFNGEDLAEIKKMFPEFKPKRAVTRASAKVPGLPVIELKRKMKEKIQLEGKQLQKLMDKLDHKNDENITWSEFLTFLENEGLRREVVNDAQLYGIGVKRLQEGETVQLKEEEKDLEYYIDCLCFVQQRRFRFLLTLFENNIAKVIDADTFEVVQEIEFKSDYALPKRQTKALHHSQISYVQQKQRTDSHQSNNGDHLSQSRKVSQSYSKNGGRLNDRLQTEPDIIEGYSIPNRDEKSSVNESVVDDGQNSTGITQMLNISTVGDSYILHKAKVIQHTQRQIRTKDIVAPSIGSRNLQTLSKSGMRATFKTTQRATVVDLANQSIANISAIQNVSTAMSEYMDQSTVCGNTFDASNKRKDSLIELQIQGHPSRNNDKSVNTTVNNLKTRSQRPQSSYVNKNRSFIRKPDITSVMDQSKSMKRNASRPKQKMYGVLGLTKIEDEEGSSAYLYGKDIQRNRSSMLVAMFPNLYQDHEINKRNFYSILDDKTKEIEDNEKTIDRIRRVSAHHADNRKNSTLKVGQSQQRKNDSVLDEEIQKIQMHLLAKQNKVQSRINSVMSKVQQQHQKLVDLDEMINVNVLKDDDELIENEVAAEFNEEAKPDKKPEKQLTGFEKNALQLKQLEKKKLDSGQQIGVETKVKNNVNPKAGEIEKGESLFEINRRNKIKHTKKVYSVCANFNQGLNILAICLIDKEVKLYKLKQNGAKVLFMDLFSFSVKFIVTCLHIEQYVVNSRPILCLGSVQGDIAIYYIDEPNIDQRSVTHNKAVFVNKKDGGKDSGSVKQLLHAHFNFFTKSEGNHSMGDERHLPSYLQPQPIESELTNIRYVRDIGLIATSLNGSLKLFDGFNFKEVWKSSNKSRKSIFHTQIACFDVSVRLGIMATGGTEGKLILFDPYAFGIIGGITAHNCGILDLFIYDDQQQIITVGADRSICIWDAFRLEKIQTLKDTANNSAHATNQPGSSTGHVATKFTSAAFDVQSGKLYTGCQVLKVWNAEVDGKVKIKALQVETLSKALLKERQSKVSTEDRLEQDKIFKKDEERDGVLVSSTSELVDIILIDASSGIDKHSFIITIDSENLVRAWSVKSGLTTFSYKISMKKRITAAAVDESGKQLLAVGNCIGEVQILNMKSGGVLYNFPHCDFEVTSLKFVSGMSEFWLVGGCWQGKLMMWTCPNEDNNFTVIGKCRIGHKQDILCVESSSQFIVSGGVDGLLSIWNLFSGTLKYAIELPPPRLVSEIKDFNYLDNGTISSNCTSRSSMSSDKQLSDLEDAQNFSSNDVVKAGFQNRRQQMQARKKEAATVHNRAIVGICFHPYYPNLVCVMQEGGDIHIIDASNGTIAYEYIAKVKINSNWACDRENQRMFIVGDVGKGVIFDMSFMAFGVAKTQNKRLIRQIVSDESEERRINKFPSFNANAIPNSSSPPRLQTHSFQMKKEIKWQILKPWFTTHQIQKLDNSYVVSVKFAALMRIYVTGTSQGEVKLWSNDIDCQCLGVLNQQGKPWDNTLVMQTISSVQKQIRSKELKEEAEKIKVIKRRMGNEEKTYKS